MANTRIQRSQDGMTVTVFTDGFKSTVQVSGATTRNARTLAMQFDGSTMEPDWIINQIFKNK